ncbi:hypothetical protein GCM10023166_28560 [Paeniglutamicibacter cryotolerans]
MGGHAASPILVDGSVSLTIEFRPETGLFPSGTNIGSRTGRIFRRRNHAPESNVARPRRILQKRAQISDGRQLQSKPEPVAINAPFRGELQILVIQDEAPKQPSLPPKAGLAWLFRAGVLNPIIIERNQGAGMIR